MTVDGRARSITGTMDEPSDTLDEVRQVALNFWVGPRNIGSKKFVAKIENVEIDPFGCNLPNSPDVQSLAADHDGIYRPSEPLSPDDAGFSADSRQLRYVESTYQRRFIDLTIGYERYMRSFSGKTRSSLKRKVRKFEEASDGEIVWESYRSVSELTQFHAVAREISKLTYQEKLFNAGMPNDEDFVASMRDLAAADAVRGYILYLSGIPVSYLYLPVDNGRVIYGHLGFDPKYAKYSPGVILQLLALEALFLENKYQTFDFTEGEGAHKKLFATAERYCGNVFYLKPTLWNFAILNLHRSVRLLSDGLTGLAERSGVKNKLRQLIRGQG
jgi:hypothetical protein